MKKIFIYALNCPDTDMTRYVGKTENFFIRFDHHLKNCFKQRTHKACWIRSLITQGKSPTLEILDEVSEEESNFWEREWIKLYRMLGFPLTNIAEGGEGGSTTKGRKHSIVTLRKMSEMATGTRNGFFGKKHSEESRKKMRLARSKRGPSLPKEVCERISVGKLLAYRKKLEDLCQKH